MIFTIFAIFTTEQLKQLIKDDTLQFYKKKSTICLKTSYFTNKYEPHPPSLGPR